MAQTMIMAGGTWIALRKLRSIQATPATLGAPASPPAFAGHLKLKLKLDPVFDDHEPTTS